MGNTKTLGIDLGGTKVNLGIVDKNGHVLFGSKFLIGSCKQPQMIIAKIVENIEKCLNESKNEAKAVGIGVAGQIDHNGIVRGSPNLGWKNFPLKIELEKKLGMPVIIINDVRAATLGEWYFGVGKGVKDLAVLFVGTGVGGGVIINGKVLKGHTNSGGELGHITIVSGGQKCRCTNHGCLEAYVGGWAIAERAQKAVGNDPQNGQTLLSIAGKAENITAATVAQAYHKGDSLSRILVEKTGRYLADGIVSIVNAFNPRLVVLGGGVIEGIPELIQIVKTIVPRFALGLAINNLEIVNASLGGDAGVIGAAALAQDFLIKNQ